MENPWSTGQCGKHGATLLEMDRKALETLTYTPPGSTLPHLLDHLYPF